MPGSTRVDFNHFPEYESRLQQAADKMVRKAALDIERLAKQKAPVDTGALRNSIYTVTSTDSDYTAASSSAGKRNQDAEQFPPVEQQPPGQAIVAVGMSYGAYVEYGTRHMAARPYLTPAAETVRPQFLAAMGRLEEMMR
jgi:HK97 gp10 family phage protein